MFKFGLRGERRNTNLQFQLQNPLQSIRRLRLGQGSKEIGLLTVAKGGNRGGTRFLSNAVHPQPISLIRSYVKMRILMW